MTFEIAPWALNTESTDSAVARHALQGVLGGAVGSFAGGVGAVNGGAHGVCNPGDLVVSQSTSPGMSVRVAAGTAFVTGTASALQGPYAVYNDAAIDVVTIAAADATNPRNDLVCAQVQDTTYDGSGERRARPFVVTGTPAAVPVDPTPPASCLVLARVNVPALDTSITNAQITDLRTFAGEAGKVIRRRDTRSSISFGTGAQAITPNGTTENLGDIALAAGTYTINTPGTYAMSVVIDPTTAFGTTSTVSILTTPGLHVEPLPNTATTGGASFVKHLAAGDTIVFSWNNGSGGAITASVVTEIARLTAR